MKLKDRMATIDANLDDLQSSVEACSRAARALHTSAASFDKILRRIKNAPLIATLARRALELQLGARDQREALMELRESIVRLQQEMKHSNGVVRPPPLFKSEPGRGQPRSTELRPHVVRQSDEAFASDRDKRTNRTTDNRSNPTVQSASRR